VWSMVVVGGNGIRVSVSGEEEEEKGGGVADGGGGR